jgi:recombinational DNA repair protein (RecF pathway)
MAYLVVNLSFSIKMVLMKLGLEGLLLHKVPHSDRHIIAQLLLRNGKRCAVMFFGGQGGGKKFKVSGLEYGNLIKAQVSSQRQVVEVASCQEWQVAWGHEHVRHHHQAFTFLCFALELVRSLSPEDQLGDQHRESDQSAEGLFRVLSNALFRLDRLVKEENFHLYGEWSIFLGKLLIEQGLFPDREHCVLSGEPLRPGQRLSLVSSMGGFARVELLKGQEQQMMGETGTILYPVLAEIAAGTYQQLPSFKHCQQNHARVLWDYFCYQTQIESARYKTLSMLL